MNRIIEQQALALINRTDCTTFPIDVYEIARRRNYNVRYYSKSKNLIQKLNLVSYSYKYSGFSIKCENKYYIFIADNLVPDEERKVIAHEIGHIILHHLDNSGVFGHSNDAELFNRYETEADEFAIYLLSPTPMLATHKIQTPEDIKKLTTLNLTDSNRAFANLANYREECCLYDDRKRLRDRYQNHRGIFKALNKIPPSTVALFFVSVIIISLCLAFGSKAKEKTVSANSPTFTDSESQTNYNVESTYYWTKFGDVFHTHEDCQALRNSSEILSGPLEQAQRLKDRLCKFCEKRDK